MSFEAFITRASEQGNVIGSVRIIINIIYYNIYYVHKKNFIEQTRELIYLNFVAIDFFLKIISPPQYW